MAYASVQDFPVHAEKRARSLALKPEAAPGWRDRLGVMLGATALGLMLGFGATIALGRLDPVLTAATAAPFYLVAVLLATRTVVDAHERRAWTTLALGLVLFAVLAAWPFALFIAAPTTPGFWFGAPMTLATQLLLIIVAPWGAGVTTRASVISLAVAALGAHQAMLYILGR